ncbi:hypothetical protein WN944_004906 [Citrus x changshan-huyou]|uniref:Uncharacterized protein n=1 Tax=Citrus x changshan-huyou TaxID=2935761 RepID=A0AAP0QJ30_9ROSI
MLIAAIFSRRSHQELDYSRTDFFINQLSGSGSTFSIGARKLKLACADIHQALDDKIKGRCLLQGLNVINRNASIVFYETDFRSQFR